jgi:hypothetical protein
MAVDASPGTFNGVAAMAMRRWYLVAIGLVLVVPLSYLAAQHVSPKYTLKASVVLLVPQKTVGPGGNPYLALGGLGAAVDVVAAGLSTDALQQEVALTGATSGVVEADGSTAAPILLITVEGPTKAAAEAGVAVYVKAVPTTLVSIQKAAGVDANQQIRSETIAGSKRPVVSHKPQLRAGLAVFIGGMGLTFIATALLDRLLRRRPDRRDRRDRHAVRSLSPTGLPTEGRIDAADKAGEYVELAHSRGRGR